MVDIDGEEGSPSYEYEEFPAPSKVGLFIGGYIFHLSRELVLLTVQLLLLCFQDF